MAKNEDPISTGKIVLMFITAFLAVVFAMGMVISIIS